jgi:hypothetical protein
VEICLGHLEIVLQKIADEALVEICLLHLEIVLQKIGARFALNVP